MTEAQRNSNVENGGLNQDSVLPGGIPLLEMNDGKFIPQLGFGTYKLDDAAAETAVHQALAVGYRHIDTASLYGNEVGVGKGIAAAIAAGVAKREDIFVTTKVWNDAQSADATRASVKASLKKLALEYVDLVLVHWPVEKQGTFVECFETLQELQREGWIRSVGVANFYPEVLDQLPAAPVVNQIELHPAFPQKEQVADDKRRGVLTQAWSPIGRGKYFAGSVLEEIGNELGKSPAQVTLRWHLQRGVIAIPKSGTLQRIEENFQITDFELTEDQMKRIAHMASVGGRQSADPRDFG